MTCTCSFLDGYSMPVIGHCTSCDEFVYMCLGIYPMKYSLTLTIFSMTVASKCLHCVASNRSIRSYLTLQIAYKRCSFYEPMSPFSNCFLCALLADRSALKVLIDRLLQLESLLLGANPETKTLLSGESQQSSTE
jgi:hypothetical protein